MVPVGSDVAITFLRRLPNVLSMSASHKFLYSTIVNSFRIGQALKDKFEKEFFPDPVKFNLTKRAKWKGNVTVKSLNLQPALFEGANVCLSILVCS